MGSPDDKRCKKCGKPGAVFKPIRKYQRNVCNSCIYQAEVAKGSSADAARKEELINIKLAALSRSKQRRLDPKNRVRTILWDTRGSDKRFGRANDLTAGFIEECISSGCPCGETVLKISLDRKDNALGHTQANCVPCCTRCNYLRRDMPYAAWVKLMPAVRQVREAGLFGSWTCGIHNRN